MNILTLWVVGEAFSSESAMKQIRISAPHLVLMDFHLPEECGMESTRRMLAQFPSVKIIALASSAKLELVYQALHAGVSGYVVKDHGFEELFRAIHVVMDFQIYLSPKVSSAVTREFMKIFIDRKPGTAGVVLSDRERLLLQLVAEGKRNKEIAERMQVTVKSVETYRFRLMKKLGCASAAALVRFAIRAGIVKA